MSKTEGVKQILLRGTAEKRSGNYYKALVLYDKANKIDPTNIWTYYNPAKVQYLMGEYIDSIQNYLKAAHISTVNMLNHINQGNPESLLWFAQIEQTPYFERVKYLAVDENAVFLFADINTPNHIGRTLSTMSIDNQPEDVKNDLENYRIELTGKNNYLKYTKNFIRLETTGEDHFTKEMFIPKGRNYLLRNLNWNQIERRELNPNLIY